MHNSSRFHPVHKCDDGLFNTASGIKVDLNRPTPEMISLQDISGALSKIARFGGHTHTFYSVAQHSVLVTCLAPDHLKKAALLHDATEAYLGDVIKPLKVILGSVYMDLEMKFTDAISQYFGVDLHAAHDQIKDYDRMALELEHAALQKGEPGSLLIALRTYNLEIEQRWAWPPEIAKMIYTATYHELFNQ